MSIMLLPWVSMVLGVVSFAIWWWAYLEQARNPKGHPPNMWVVTALHLLFVGLGLAAFALSPISQLIIFYVFVGISIFVLLIAR